VTLTFDLLTSKVDRFISLPRRPLVAISVEKSVHLFSNYRVREIGKKRTNGRTDGLPSRKHYPSGQSVLAEA